jgi:hypothetical protein
MDKCAYAAHYRQVRAHCCSGRLRCRNSASRINSFHALNDDSVGVPWSFSGRGFM